MKKKKVIYDCESLPNFFCIVFSELDGDKIITYEISKNKCEHQEIINMIRYYILIGHNAHGYDDVILNYIISNQNCTAEGINIISQSIIAKDTNIYGYHKHRKWVNSIDTMTMLASSKLRVSLKHLQVMIKWHNVLEFECDWKLPLPESRWEECIDYCKNDVLSLKAVCKTLEKDFELRAYVHEQTGLDVLSKDPVKIAELAMCDAVMRGMSSIQDVDSFMWNVSQENSKVKRIVIKDLINDFILFKTPRFQKLLKTYQQLVYRPIEEADKKSDDKFGYPMRFDHMWLVFGVGGAHHNYGLKTGNKKFKPKGLTIRPNKGEKLIQCDVSGFYPSQRLDLNYSHPFDPWLYNEYAITRVEKLEGKATGNKLLEGYGKLKGNSVYGLYNSFYSPLYYPNLAFQTAINGQLMLAMLIENLYITNFKVVGVNTDAVNVIIPDNRWDEYIEICSKWEKITKMKLDHEEFIVIYEQSCNNYIAVKPNGGSKTKGFFKSELELLKGYMYPIVKIALIKYFKDSIPIEKTIMEHEDIYDFCMSTKMGTAKNGNKFEAFYNQVKLQKTNRYFASTNGAYLYKSAGGTMQHVLTDSGVTIFNKYEEKVMKDYKINYKFYLKKARNMQREIEPEQLTLF